MNQSYRMSNIVLALKCFSPMIITLLALDIILRIVGMPQEVEGDPDSKIAYIATNLIIYACIFISMYFTWKMLRVARFIPRSKASKGSSNHSEDAGSEIGNDNVQPVSNNLSNDDPGEETPEGSD